MKKIIFTLQALFIASFAMAQVAIGGKPAIDNPNVSLEFESGNRGIILPWVTSASAVTGAVDGTFIYDTSDKKVKFLKGGTWTDLSIDTTGVVDTTLQTLKTEQASAKVTIGKDGAKDTTPGILVLTDTDKAMVLPKVASPHLNIINPSAGMMAYDTTAHQLAVFNGTVWSFWKP